jgi:hypothetical protein
MQRGLFSVLVILALVPVLAFGAGKIRGKVTDAGTGEPLVGANVVVVGSSMGAATNIAGEFVILNVPAGTYAMKTSYVGYQSITISNNRVNNDLTTEVNFQLPAEGVTVATVEIIAERPLINKSATNAVRIVDQEFFNAIPARGINAAIALQPGVIVMGTTVYIRGGRPDEVGFKVDGVGIGNVLSGGRAVNITDAAVEQIQVQAGGFNAEYGGANAGIIQTQLRTGDPERWKVSVLGETDNFTSQNKEALGGYSYGYTDFTATAGGPFPLWKKLRLFASVQNTFYRDPTQSLRNPLNYTGANALITDPGNGVYHPGVSQRDTLSMILGGNAVGGMDNRWTTMATALFDFTPVQVRLSGSLTNQTTRGTTWFGNYFNKSRLAVGNFTDGFGNIRISHVLSPTTFYEANFNYFTNKAQSMDPDFQDDLFAYGDSIRNANLGYRLRGNSLNCPAWGLFGGYTTINQPGTQIAGYSLVKQQSMGGRLDFTTQWKQHEFKVGGEYTRYQIRRYAPSSVFQWYKQKQEITDPAKLEVALMKAGGTGSDTYGYDVYGQEIENDVIRDEAMYYFGPRKPVFAAAYLQDKIEFSDIILNLGVRWDYIEPDSWDVYDPTRLTFNKDDLIKAVNFKKTDKTSQISPRIGFSFPVTDRTVFHAQYGKFIQQTRLYDSYLAAAGMAGIIKGGFYVTGNWGWGLLPTKTTQYEMGFSQQISDAASFDITAFYKDIQDQITNTLITPAAGAEGQNYFAYVNSDFATSKGLEFKFTLRRTERITAQVNYTFADTRATGSNSASSVGIYSAGSTVELPKYVFPADFDFANSGNVLFDYRFGKNDGGPILQQLGLNMLLSFNSGHAYTRVDAQQRAAAPTDNRFRIPVEPIGSSTTPWFFQLDARLDKTVGLGPIDATFYIYVINLLGTDNATNVFTRSGDPADDGWFATQAGANDAATNGQQYVDFRRALNGQNSGYYGPPRQIRFGLRLDY